MCLGVFRSMGTSRAANWFAPAYPVSELTGLSCQVRAVPA
jgi:hypothetical protein